MAKRLLAITVISLAALADWAQCPDFTDLTAPGVICQYGTFVNPFQYTGIAVNRHTVITQQGTDPSTNFQLPFLPPGESAVVRLGNNTGGEAEAITYQFDKEYEVSNVQVYWLEFDHYDGDFRTPESWKLYYKTTNGEWQEVEENSAYGVRKDCYNSVDFKPIKTTSLKILAKLQDGQSGGILEWKVNR